jgi:restriction endonuclease S subunit
VSFTSQELFKKSSKGYIKEKDILILAASHQLDYIGRSFALVSDIPNEYKDNCMAVGELIIARTKTDKLLPEFLIACFALLPVQELVNRMTRGQSAHLYADDLGKLQIPVPDLDVQREIAAEVARRRTEAKRLQAEGEQAVSRAKLQVEQMILGESVE